MSQFNDVNLPNTTHTFAARLDDIIKQRTVPAYIAIEGPIGVGKTTLTKKLAESFGYETLLERAEENPFLEKFYSDQQQNALATQLFFLFQRVQQIADLHQGDLFAPTRVADFLIEKDKLFAKAVLTPDEFTLYEQVYAQLTINAATPDLVIYLQAPVDVLMNRISQRGIRMEQHIDRQYLEQLNQAYSDFFLYYDRAPVLIINSSEADFSNNDDDFIALVDHMLNIKGGTHYFNPTIFS